MKARVILLGGILFGILLGCSSDTPGNQQPNILFIVADDLGFTDLGAFGGEISTPNLDELAFAGVRLNNFHTDRACQQTRVMMMASSGVSGALEYFPPAEGSRERRNRLSLNWATLPELLQDAGYDIEVRPADVEEPQHDHILPRRRHHETRQEPQRLSRRHRGEHRADVVRGDRRHPFRLAHHEPRAILLALVRVHPSRRNRIFNRLA